MAKKRRIKITKGEKLLYTMAFFAFLGTLVVQVFCGASVGHLNMSVEVLKYNIDTQERKNESLVMQVNELTSYENLSNVLKDMGLVKKAIDVADPELKDMICASIVDMAKLSHNTLTGDDKSAFIDRSAQILNMLIK